MIRVQQRLTGSERDGTDKRKHFAAEFLLLGAHPTGSSEPRSHPPCTLAVGPGHWAYLECAGAAVRIQKPLAAREVRGEAQLRC